jgi:FkbM family methyltransferase
MSKIYECFGVSFTPLHVVEVGVAAAIDCNTAAFVLSGTRTQLVEPSVGSYDSLKKTFGHLDNVKIWNVAVSNHCGYESFVDCGKGSSLDKSNSPAKRFNNKWDSYKRVQVACVTFDKIDDGTIDVLHVDIEGGEQAVLDFLVSRPRIIRIETHETHAELADKKKIAGIYSWMNENGYTKIGNLDGDTVFLKDE